MFQVVEVDRARAVATEHLGSKSKFWFWDDDRWMLFKAEERGTGEDWAEKVAAELCRLLGLPHVNYELAELVEAGRYILPGVVCETCAPWPIALVHGNQLLVGRDPEYPTGARFKVRAHTVDAVAEVLRTLEPPPPNWMELAPPNIRSALDVFSGFLLLDAWIANQDRHHENWGALQIGERLSLAPTFDHGGALARNELDGARGDRLTTRDRNRTVQAFARRARSALYRSSEDPRPLGTLEAFRECSKHTPEATRAWLEQLAAIEDERIQSILHDVPPGRMSGVTRDFTWELLRINRGRLLEPEDV